MKPLVLLLLAAVIGLTAYLYVVVPKGFFPQQESPLLFAGVRADQSVSFQSMQRKLQQIVGIIHDDPRRARAWSASPAATGRAAPSS